MKRFSTRIIWCLVPVVVAALVCGLATRRYVNGEGGYRLGIDLAGGTDLIYEVDTSKYPDGKLPEKYTPELVAAVLKRRIDPADLYNVTIRPVSFTRFEIVLPTGGQHQSQAEEKAWKDLLAEVDKKWPPKAYKAPVGHKTELLARVNEQWPGADTAEIRKFIDDTYKPVAGADEAKQAEAWNKVVTEVGKKWPPKAYDVGRGRLQILVSRVHEQYPDVTPLEISQFIEEHYSVSKERRQLTGEEVQHIKELISRSGSLEFKILANDHDDVEAIAAAKKFFEDAKKDPKLKAELENRAVAGQPPPPPVNSDGKLQFPTATNIGSYTYTWVELGKGERANLGLSNTFEKGPTDPRAPRPAVDWKEAANAREKGDPLTISGGSLLWSRKATALNVEDRDQDKKYEYFLLTRDSEPGKEVSGDFLVDAKEAMGQNLGLEVVFRFNSEGGARFYDLTSKNKPEGTSEGAFRRFLAVVLEGKIESAPRLNAVISTEGRIEGRFTKDDVDRLVTVLRSGSLPASLKREPVSESTLGPTLGEDTIRAGALSVGLSFVAVLIFMVVYYRFAGLVACVALFANLLLTIAFMVLVNATFTLPGLAGLVLMLAMAVDANVLIYERLREERDRGASLALAIRNGYDRAFPTIIDTHLSSIFTAIVLYAVGNDQLKGFGISLTVGLIISLFTSLVMTRLLFDIWQHQGWLHKLSMFRFLSKPNFDFMAIRYYWFTATILLTIFGASVFIWRLDKGGLNIDFMGGTAYGGRLNEMVDARTLRDMLSRSDLPDLSIEQIFVNSPEFSQGDRTKLFTVRTAERDADKVQTTINKLLGDKLARTEMTYELGSQPKEKTAVLDFKDPTTGKPAFASRAQVSMLLARQFEHEGQKTAAQQFVLEGLGKEEDGRFQWMQLSFLQPLDRPVLDGALKATQGDFAARPQPERLEVFDGQLAKETQLRALYAILASWGAILLYLWFRFGNWTFGVATVVCLIHDLFFTLGIIAFCHYIHEWMPSVASALLIQDFKIDLPTVAALLTLVGYSVSDTIVVFDRIREVRGKNPLLTPQMINDSVNQTLSRTLLTSFITWLVVFVLYIWGGEGVHLFAFVMVVGVIVGTYSSIYIASPLLLIFGEGRPHTPVRERQPQPEGAVS